MANFWPTKWLRPVQGAPTVLTNPQSTAVNQYFGRTTIASAANGVHFINAGAVTSDANISLLLQEIVTGSAAVPQMAIRSINVGSGFSIGPVGSFALTNSYIVHWELKRKS